MATGTDLYTIELVDRVSGPAGRASRSMGQLDSSMRRAGRGGALAQLALNSLASAIGNIAARGFSRGIDAVVGLGSAIADTAKLASSAKFALNAVYGGTEGGAKALAQGKKIARAFGLDLEFVLDTLGKFRGVGFNDLQSETLLKLGADLRALKIPEDALGRFFLALSQIKTKGRLAAQEINQLAEAGGAAFSREKVFKILGDRLGKTREQVIALQETGKISGDLGIAAVLESIAKTANVKDFGELGSRFGTETVEGIADKIKSNLKVDLFEAVARAEPGLVKGLTAIAQGFAGGDTGTFQDALTAGLTKFGETLEKIGPQIPSFIASLEKVASVLG